MEDLRGPKKKIVSVRRGTGDSFPTLLTLDCGHVKEANSIYSYRIGDRSHCLQCRVDPPMKGNR